MDIDGILHEDRLGFQLDGAFEDAGLCWFVPHFEEGFLLRRDFQQLGLNGQNGSVIMAKLNGPSRLPIIFNGDLLLMLLANLQKPHINKRLKEYLALHLIHPNRQFHSQPILTDDPNDLSLILKLLAFILDLRGGGQPGGYLRLHGIDDLKVGVF